jgi:hypothetical protein
MSDTKPVLASFAVGDWFITLTRVGGREPDGVRLVATSGGVRRSEWLPSYSVALARAACFVRIVESNETQGLTRAARGFERQVERFFGEAVTK